MRSETHFSAQDAICRIPLFFFCRLPIHIKYTYKLNNKTTNQPQTNLDQKNNFLSSKTEKDIYYLSPCHDNKERKRIFAFP